MQTVGENAGAETVALMLFEGQTLELVALVANGWLTKVSTTNITGCQWLAD